MSLDIDRRAALALAAAAIATSRIATAKPTPATPPAHQYQVETPDATIQAYSWPSHTSKKLPLLVGLHGGGFNAHYYNSPGYSLVDAATKAGFGIVLLDRPGYGHSSLAHRQGDILTQNGQILNNALGQIWRKSGAGHPGIVLVGHSIGGAVALLIAGLPHDYPFLGVSVSGVADARPPAGILAPPGPPHAPGAPPPPPSVAALKARFSIFFAPGAETDRALDALIAATDPSPMVFLEGAAIYSTWIKNFPATAAAIKVPVQLRLAEYERLWQTGQPVVDRIRLRFTHSPQVDVALFPGVGHTIEYHPQGKLYLAQILAFAKDCAQVTPG